MNKPVSDLAFRFPRPLPPRAPELQELFDHIAHGEAERERERILPFEVIDLIRLSRLGALRIPVAAGGSGSTLRELFEIVIRLAEADANVAHILRNHFSSVEMYARTPDDEQGRRWQKAVADGAIIGLASAELSNPRVGGVIPDTKLTPDGDGYRLNGRKYYSTGTLYADFVMVRATDSSGSVASVIIPAGREGITRSDDWDGAGQRLTGTGTTTFSDVRVERQEAVFDTPNKGQGLPYYNTQAQLFLTAVNAGILRAILRDATSLVRARGRTFYYAPAERADDDPILQQTIGQISANAFAAECVVLAAAEALDRKSAAYDANDLSIERAAHAALLAAKAKIIVDELAIRSGSLLFDVGGASSTERSHNFDRHWRNARTLSSHNPTTLKARAIGDHEVNGTPLFHQLPARPIDRRGAGLQRLDDLAVTPSLATFGNVGFQQDPRLHQSLRRAFPLPDQRVELLAFLRAQLHDIFLYRNVSRRHDSPPSLLWRRERIIQSFQIR
jgi:alkylation response protein AidB-like acyl-CoA dehydrogenase